MQFAKKDNETAIKITDFSRDWIWIQKTRTLGKARHAPSVFVWSCCSIMGGVCVCVWCGREVRRRNNAFLLSSFIDDFFIALENLWPSRSPAKGAPHTHPPAQHEVSFAVVPAPLYCGGFEGGLEGILCSRTPCLPTRKARVFYS